MAKNLGWLRVGLGDNSTVMGENERTTGGVSGHLAEQHVVGLNLKV